MNFCSRAAQASAAPLAGTGVRAGAYLFLPVAKQLWGDTELNTDWASPEELAAIKAARPQGIVTRLYHPAKGDFAAAALVYREPGAGPSAALDGLLALLSQRWGVDASEAPRLAICTHGTRDRCCAKWGFAAYREALRLHGAGLSAFEPLECSHLGGDRFAATGIFLPSGSMYAHLDSVDLAAVCAMEAQGAIAPAAYRGRVFEDALTQIVRAGLARDGVGVGATSAIQLLEHGTAAEARVRAGLKGGEQEFLVELELVEGGFFSNCSAMDRGRLARGRRLAYVRSRAVAAL